MGVVGFRMLRRALFATLFSLTSQAALLGTFSLTTQTAAPAPIPQVVSIRFAVGSLLANCFNFGACASLGGYGGINTTAVGTELPVYLPGPFSNAGAILANGALDYISVVFRFGPSVPPMPGGGIGFPETAFGTAPDFTGYVITQVLARIDSLTFSERFFPVGLPLTPVLHSVADIGVTLRVFGEPAGAPVPEPSAWILLAAGTCLLTLRRILF
jgi:hypothetical protein